MADQRLAQRKLLGVKTQSAEGTFDVDALLAPQCRLIVENMVFDFDQQYNQPNAQRPFLGIMPGTPGKRMARLTFEVLDRGSGTPGTPAPDDPLLIACGKVKTIKTGSAVTGTLIPDPKNPDAPAGLPAISGTYTGDKSGFYRITQINTVDSNDVRIEFFSYDGTGRRQFNDTGYFNDIVEDLDGDPQAFGDTNGLLIAIGTFQAETDGYAWILPVTSADEVSVEYADADVKTNSVSLACFEDGVVQKIHTARGTVRYQATTGGYARWFYDFMGCLLDSGETATLAFPGSIAFPNVITASVLSEYLQLNAVTPPCWTDFEIDWKKRVEMLSCAGEATGYEAARITGYTGPISLKFNPLAQLVGTSNPYADLITGALGTGVAYRHGSVAGNILEIESQLNQTVVVKGAVSEGNMRHAIEVSLPAPGYSETENYSPTIIRRR